MSFAQHLKLNKKRGQLAWWSRRNKNYIATADSNTSIIANMEQDIIGQCNVTKKSQMITGGSNGNDHVINMPSHDDKLLLINNEEKTGKISTRPTIVDKGTTNEVGVQCSDMTTDALKENTRRIQAKLQHIQQTMIDYYSTLVWCEHRGHPKLAMVYIDAYIILMDQLFSHNEASSLDGVVNIRRETREEFQRKILPYQERYSSTTAHLPAECILAYQEIIYHLLATRGIIVCKSQPSSSIRKTPVTVLKHKRHNTISIFMITILLCGIYYVILNV